jgi:hypothetical protein
LQDFYKEYSTYNSPEANHKADSGGKVYNARTVEVSQENIIVMELKLLIKISSVATYTLFGASINLVSVCLARSKSCIAKAFVNQLENINKNMFILLLTPSFSSGRRI